MNVRRADVRDVPAICRLRDAYYTKRGDPIQVRWDNVDWWVAESDAEIVAVQSYSLTCPTECFVMDSYTDATSRGARGLAALSARIAEEADQRGLYLLGLTHVDDEKIIRHSLARGWQISGLLLGRAPRIVRSEAV